MHTHLKDLTMLIQIKGFLLPPQTCSHLRPQTALHSMEGKSTSWSRIQAEASLWPVLGREDLLFSHL